MRLKRKKERKTEKKNCKEGRGKKPKIEACLNSQLIRKVNKVKKTKQNKQKQVKKKYMLNNESPLIKTCTTSLF